jgi:DNA-binding transcriptional regulator YiaG
MANSKTSPISDEELYSELKRAHFMAELILPRPYGTYENDAERVNAIPSPKPMSCQEIVSLRRKHSVSQRVFARLLNVSVKTVQSWEQGTRVPSDAALKLLSLAKHKRDALLLDIIPDPD